MLISLSVSNYVTGGIIEADPPLTLALVLVGGSAAGLGLGLGLGLGRRICWRHRQQ